MLSLADSLFKHPRRCTGGIDVVPSNVRRTIHLRAKRNALGLTCSGRVKRRQSLETMYWVKCKPFSTSHEWSNFRKGLMHSVSLCVQSTPLEIATPMFWGKGQQRFLTIPPDVKALQEAIWVMLVFNTEVDCQLFLIVFFESLAF